jgi:hypothetical protein
MTCFAKTFKNYNRTDFFFAFAEPTSIDLHVDGTTDKCSLGEDINFKFTGFSITGKVSHYHIGFTLLHVTYCWLIHDSDWLLLNCNVSSLDYDFFFHDDCRCMINILIDWILDWLIDWLQVVSEGQTEGPEGVSLSLLDTTGKQTLQTVLAGIGGRWVLGDSGRGGFRVGQWL